MSNTLSYTFISGKNNKVLYFAKSYLCELVPHIFYAQMSKKLSLRLHNHPQNEYLQKRIDYYCRLSAKTQLPDTCTRLKDYTIPDKAKTYYFDSKEVFRYFDNKLRWNFWPGDVVTIPPIPTIVKSRPLLPNNQNSVLLKLDKIRHFTFVKDKLPVEQKKPMALFIGKITGKPNRIQFMHQWFESTICHCNIVDNNTLFPSSWYQSKRSLKEQLQYRFIVALEGNDVASNLKWVMSSNSVAIMPKPTCETWFMEGTLIPNFHYIEIKQDFSDLEEKINYYNEHVEQTKKIVENAHKFVNLLKMQKKKN